MRFSACMFQRLIHASRCRRYGLLGVNGCGKSTMLKAIKDRDIPIPKVPMMFS